MNRYILFLCFSCAILFTVSCSNHDKYTINGHISNAEGQYVYFDKLNVSSVEKIDSIKLKKKGNFEFKGNVGYPTFFMLKIGDKNFITLLVDSSEHVEIYGDAVNFSQNYRLKGSNGSSLVQQLNVHLSKTKHMLDSLQSLNISFINDVDYENKKKKWKDEYQKVKQSQIDYSSDFVKEHAFSMANVLALYQKFNDNTYVIQDLNSLKIAASALNSVYPKSEHVKALYANTVKLMEDQRRKKLQKFIDENAQNSPEIVLPDTEGEEIALSSLRGKYVLVQFWAGADKGSRIMNPVLTEIYKKYHSRGFEIYQVSADTNRYDWVDAIDKDHLSWINVGDMKGSRSALLLYNVQELPSNYILDKEGNILGKNLKGQAITKILENELSKRKLK